MLHRYGAVPVVRRTGGLADTVKDVDSTDAGETPNGFTFDGVDEASEDGALDRALAYFHRKDWWAEVRADACKPSPFSAAQQQVPELMSWQVRRIAMRGQFQAHDVPPSQKRCQQATSVRAFVQTYMALVIASAVLPAADGVLTDLSVCSAISAEYDGGLDVG